jgi:hypothetical protein
VVSIAASRLSDADCEIGGIPSSEILPDALVVPAVWQPGGRLVLSFYLGHGDAAAHVQSHCTDWTVAAARSCSCMPPERDADAIR